MERQNPLTSRGASAIAMAVEGHEDQFPLCRLNARCVIRKETFAGTYGNGRDTPSPVVHFDAICQLYATPWGD
jgi:hypothetical protein